MKKQSSRSSLKLSFSNSSQKGGKVVPAGQYRWTPALRIVAGLLVFSFLTLSIRLFLLQIVQKEYFQAKSQEKTNREKILPASRGEIRDLAGTVLATDEPLYRLLLIPKEYFDHPLLIDKFIQIGKFTDYQKGEIIKKLENCRKQDQETKQRKNQANFAGSNEPMKTQVLCEEKKLFLFDGLSLGQAEILESSHAQLPGIYIESRKKRIYFQGASPRKINPGEPRPDLFCSKNRSEACLFTHVLGYMNEVENKDLLRDSSYQPGNLVGRSGIERAFESYLRGKPGREQTFVEFTNSTDSEKKKPIERKVKQDAVAGNHVILNIDIRFQKMVKQALNMRDYWQYAAKSAAVVEIETGKVLALVSTPALDPNFRMTTEEAVGINADPARPLQDKVLYQMYSPASTFKLFTALAAFRKKEKERFPFDPKKKIVCKGEFIFKKQRFGCTGHHGKVDLHDAIQKSCNAYFFQLAQEVGLDSIAETANQFGLGQTLHLGMGESTGIIPTEKYYENHPYYRKHGGFLPGYTLMDAIGQQDVRVTVLQMVMAYAAFANGGNLYQPLLVDRVEDTKGNIVKKFDPMIRNQIPIAPSVYEYIVQALRDVVQKKGGTAYKYVAGVDKKVPIDLAGKTGTAELGKKGKKSKNKDKDNAWFVGFAPATHPQIAIAVFIEHGGHGGEIAAPIAMKIAQDYFEKIAPERAKNVSSMKRSEHP